MKLRIRRIVMTLAGVATLSASVLSTTGCGAFFQCEGKADCGTGTTTSGAGSGDYAYVTNSASSSNGIPYLDAFDVSKGLLTPLTGSPYQLAFAPTALAIAPSNKFLYAASMSNAGIYLYSLASTGVPSLVTSGTSNGLMASDSGAVVYAMTISPDGNWLYTIEELATGTWELIQYSLNTSTGIMTFSQSLTTPATTCIPSYTTTLPYTQLCGVAVSPNEGFVVVAAGAGGAILYPYSSSATGGITGTYTGTLQPYSASSADTSVTIDNANYVYIGQTQSISTYSIGTGGVPTSLNSSGYGQSTQQIPFTNTETPRNITLSTSYGYVYTADQGTGGTAATATISSYSASNGVLTSLGAEVPGPPAVSALGVDNTGAYLLAAGYNGTSGIELYSISGTTGALTSLVQSAGTGVNNAYPTLIVMTYK
jgi:6-phosphogluconolactonase